MVTRARAGLARAIAPDGVWGFDAGRQSRLDYGYSPIAVGPNLLNDQTLDLVRRRVRQLVESHPLLTGALETIKADVVGTGIYPIPDTGDTDLDDALEDLWWRACEGVDVGRETPLPESQKLFFAELFTAGDTGVHVPIAPAFDGFPEGPAIELIDSDRLDLRHSEEQPGKIIRQAVEHDALGRRVAFHVMRDHPSDGGVLFAAPGFDTVRMGRDVFRLVRLVRRPNQIRGVPVPVAIVNVARMGKGFEEAYLALARAAACYGIWFEGLSQKQLLAGQKINVPTDADGRPLRSTEPGTIGFMPQGAKLHVANAAVPPPTFESVVNLLYRTMGTGIGQSYADFTGDYGRANFSSERASQLAKRRKVRPFQETIWHWHTRPYWNAWARWQILTGKVQLGAKSRARWIADPQSLLGCTVIFPGFEWVNPHQEAGAAEIELRNGTNNVPDICASRGVYWKDSVRKQINFERYWADQRAEAKLPPMPLGASASVTPGQPAGPADDIDPETGEERDDPAPPEPQQPNQPERRSSSTRRGILSWIR